MKKKRKFISDSLSYASSQIEGELLESFYVLLLSVCHFVTYPICSGGCGPLLVSLSNGDEPADVEDDTFQNEVIARSPWQR